MSGTEPNAGKRVRAGITSIAAGPVRRCGRQTFRGLRRLVRNGVGWVRVGGAAIGELVWPSVCRWCGDPVREGEDFCAACDTALNASRPLMTRACPVCGLPRPAGPELRQAELGEGQATCGRCRVSDFEFDRVIPLWAYQDRVCDAVVAAKYVHQTPLADALGRRLAAMVAAAWGGEPRPDLVTFVPSHVVRQFVRGGQGIEPVAEAMAKALSRPCRGILKMNRRIAKQAWLDDRGRVENVRGAFSLRRGYAFSTPHPLAGQHILLVDDVLTTGATANEIARVLRAGGASRVTLAVIARAIRSPR